jgi:phosphate-selective porin OprO/OprP
LRLSWRPSKRGGVQAITALGIDWYLKSNSRSLLDYQHVSVDRLYPASVKNPEPFGPPPATPPIGVQVGQSRNIIALRSQFSLWLPDTLKKRPPVCG